MSNDTAFSLLRSVVKEIGMAHTMRLLTRVCQENGAHAIDMARRAWLRDAGTCERNIAKLVN